VILPLRGRFGFRDQRTRAVASSARALFLRSRTPFTILHPEGAGDESLSIRGNVADQLVAAGQAVRAVTCSAYARVSALLRDLSSRSMDRLEIEEALCAALAPAERLPLALTRRDRAITEAITHALELRYDSRLPLAELAAAEGVSVFHACRAFRRVMGTSIHRHQQEARLRHALALLLDTPLPLAQVALESGFANQGHFGNSFRRRFGLTPGSARTPDGRRHLCRALPAPVSGSDTPGSRHLERREQGLRADWRGGRDSNPRPPT